MKKTTRKNSNVTNILFTKESALKFTALVMVWLMVSLSIPQFSLGGLLNYNNGITGKSSDDSGGSDILSALLILISFAKFGTGAAEAHGDKKHKAVDSHSVKVEHEKYVNNFGDSCPILTGQSIPNQDYGVIEFNSEKALVCCSGCVSDFNKLPSAEKQEIFNSIKEHTDGESLTGNASLGGTHMNGDEHSEENHQKAAAQGHYDGDEHRIESHVTLAAGTGTTYNLYADTRTSPWHVKCLTDYQSPYNARLQSYPSLDQCRSACSSYQLSGNYVCDETPSTIPPATNNPKGSNNPSAPTSNCGSITWDGTCEGTSLKWCENNEIRQLDCRQVLGSDWSCGYIDSYNGNGCIQSTVSITTSDPSSYSTCTSCITAGFVWCPPSSGLSSGCIHFYDSCWTNPKITTSDCDRDETSTALPPLSGTSSDVISITNPSDGAVVSGRIDVTTSVSSSVKMVEFWVDGNLKSTDTSPPYSWSGTLPRGNHNIVAVASDSSRTILGGASVSVSMIDTLTCDDCRTAGGAWCISRNNYATPRGYCAKSGSCNSGETEYAVDCPSEFICEEACGTYFYSRFYQYGQTSITGVPVGACYSNTFNIAQISARFATVGGNVNEIWATPPRPIGSGLCGGSDEACWCGQLKVASSAGGGSATIPGTTRTQHWPPSDEYYIKEGDAPRKLNDVDCTQRSDASIRSVKINGQSTGGATKIIAAGQPVTVEGEIGYFSDVCNGYVYTCEKFTVPDMRCDQGKEGFLGLTQYRRHKACPSNLPVKLGGEGEESDFCLGCLVDIFAFVGAVVIGIVTGNPQLAIAIGQTVMQLTPVLDGCPMNLAGVACAGFSWTRVGTGGKIPGQNVPIQTGPSTIPRRFFGAPYVEEDKVLSTSPFATVGVAYAQDFRNPCGNGVCEQGENSFNCLVDCPNTPIETSPTTQQTERTDTTGLENPADEESKSNLNLGAGVVGGLGSLGCGMPSFSCNRLGGDECWSVCGKEYQTTAAGSPRCSQGGAVKSYTESRYSCPNKPCGSLANYAVAITVMRGDDTIMEDTTTTDENGKFSYTFTAPSLDDAVTVMVKVKL